ncbi:energy transducer TonB [Pontibacter anaerobius]|uniref:Energy transducer TonB n=1 Tax=Pontibacter anaerobius TaxID=2993940 RepID=A0ABT3RDH2_9BACT|nr:energy transducer TonB [Pontibacter anaerobius]MCX2739901.1 energy transducer TonB [Pontibacter anaerobius]
MNNKLFPAALLFAATLITAPALAQKQDTDEPIYTYVEQMPVFEGGMGAMMQFIGSQVTYSNTQPEGMVVLSFIVDKDGSVDSVHVVKSLDPALDAACVNAVNAMSGKWTSGVQKGEPVAVRFTLPVKFGKSDLKDSGPETMPEYKGGAAAFKAFMKKNAKYPRKGTKHGTVVVSFVIHEDGSLSDYQIESSVEPVLDKEALRLARLTEGNWLPAVKDGEKVKVTYTMPVYF